MSRVHRIETDESVKTLCGLNVFKAFLCSVTADKVTCLKCQAYNRDNRIHWSECPCDKCTTKEVSVEHIDIAEHERKIFESDMRGAKPMNIHLETSRTEKDGKAYCNFACGKSYVAGRLSTTLIDNVTCEACKVEVAPVSTHFVLTGTDETGCGEDIEIDIPVTYNVSEVSCTACLWSKNYALALSWETEEVSKFFAGIPVVHVDIMIDCEACGMTKPHTNLSNTLCVECYDMQDYVQGADIEYTPEAAIAEKELSTVAELGRHSCNGDPIADMDCTACNTERYYAPEDKGFMRVITDHLDSLKSFASRKRYMDRGFPFLGAGSGRRVYYIGENRVIKIAKNDRGKAQNEVESDSALHDWYGKLLPSIYDTAPDNSWLVCDKLVHVRARDFQSYFGVSMNTLFYYMEYRLDSHMGIHAMELIDQVDKDSCDTNDKIQALLDAIVNFDLVFRDLTRKNAWGKLGDRLVLRDYGLTRYVWDEYYKPTKIKGVRGQNTQYVAGEKKAREINGK